MSDEIKYLVLKNIDDEYIEEVRHEVTREIVLRASIVIQAFKDIDTGEIVYKTVKNRLSGTNPSFNTLYQAHAFIYQQRVKAFLNSL